MREPRVMSFVIVLSTQYAHTYQ